MYGDEREQESEQPVHMEARDGRKGSAATLPCTSYLLLSTSLVTILIAGVLVYTIAPEAEGHGTDAAVAAFHRAGGFIRARVGPLKLIASAITIGSGGAAGREGPTALITGAVGSFYATLAKRSILALQKLCEDAGLRWITDYRLMMPIHDELVFSVRKDVALAFIPLLRQAMESHSDIVQHFPLNCTVAMGRTFRPFDETNPAMSQIELDEAQIIPGVVDKELKGSKLTDEKVAELLEFMFR